jgi:hypothetical protein
MTARACGDCTLCCKVMAIEELAKPAGQWCRHCKPGCFCLIYQTRPSECRDFNCLWLIDERFGAHWKPSKSKLVVTISEDGIEIRCDPGFPDAWRKQPYRGEIKNLAASGEAHDVSVLVIAGERMILVASDREFDLGVVGTDERIVREYEGNRVVGATVVKSRDLEGEA